MSDLESAEAMVQYYSERPPRLGPCTMVVRYSNYEELKTEPSPKVCLTTQNMRVNIDGVFDVFLCTLNEWKIAFILNMNIASHFHCKLFQIC